MFPLKEKDVILFKLNLNSVKLSLCCQNVLYSFVAVNMKITMFV